ncbi:MAG: HPr family phosphocarrier protein [Clostridiales bacterium]|jgi:phosphotransferase system HPr-like phosphotransfer protein|nr:HPr family phosphocarrier protein [Clostridiales bacterium]
MKTVNIKLDKMDSIHRFVKIVERYPFDVDLRQHRYLVDAKSLLGVCSLDTTRHITMDIHTDKYDNILDELDSFIVKE